MVVDGSTESFLTVCMPKLARCEESCGQSFWFCAVIRREIVKCAFIVEKIFFLVKKIA